jgi:hypothetical protein
MSSVRVEHKYLLTTQQYLAIRGLVSNICGGNDSKLSTYPVTSLYYDTPNKEYFFQKVNGEHRHLKIRIRKYSKDFEDSSKSWLETKIKIDDRITKKRQGFDSKNDIKKPKDWPLTTRHDLLIERAQHVIRPSCFISYDREAFEMLHKSNKLRITFDHNISAYKPNETRTHIHKIFSSYTHKKILLEIKYHKSEYPVFLQKLLHQFSLKRVYFSKYAEGFNFLEQII